MSMGLDRTASPSVTFTHLCPSWLSKPRLSLVAKRAQSGLVKGTAQSSFFGCFASRPERRVKREGTLCSRPGQRRHGRTFRTVGCGPKRAYPPQTPLLTANSRTTNLGPFGEVICATSSITLAIPIRWSTRYTDLETDLVYYGYRYYNPSTGRWGLTAE